MGFSVGRTFLVPEKENAYRPGKFPSDLEFQINFWDIYLCRFEKDVDGGFLLFVIFFGRPNGYNPGRRARLSCNLRHPHEDLLDTDAPNWEAWREGRQIDRENRMSVGNPPWIIPGW